MRLGVIGTGKISGIYLDNLLSSKKSRRIRPESLHCG